MSSTFAERLDAYDGIDIDEVDMAVSESMVLIYNGWTTPQRYHDKLPVPPQVTEAQIENNGETYFVLGTGDNDHVATTHAVEVEE